MGADIARIQVIFVQCNDLQILATVPTRLSISKPKHFSLKCTYSQNWLCNEVGRSVPPPVEIWIPVLPRTERIVLARSHHQLGATWLMCPIPSFWISNAKMASRETVQRLGFYTGDLLLPESWCQGTPKLGDWKFKMCLKRLSY
jgi:hypothetical protein